MWKKKSLFLNRDAASLVRTIFKAVKYIHDSGIVHRGIVVLFCLFSSCVNLLFELDLKPENLLFRTTEEDADIMLADFGLSRIMEEEKLNMLTEICGTPGVSFSFVVVFPKKKIGIVLSFVNCFFCSIWRLRFSKKVGCGANTIFSQPLIVLFLSYLFFRCK